MITKHTISIWAVIYISLFCSILYAAEESKNGVYADPRLGKEFVIPDKYDLVNDYWGAFSVSQALGMRDKLRMLERHNGTQIVVLVIPSSGISGTCPYAEKVFKKWDIGNNGQGNGLLFLIEANGSYCIRTGIGIAGALPDARIHKIIREKFDHALKNSQDFDDKVIENMVDAMIAAAEGEGTLATNYQYDKVRWLDKSEHIAILIICVFCIVYIGALALKWARRRQDRSAE